MKRLKQKIFYTIFSIISIFLILIVFVFNFQNYKEEYNKLKMNLTRMNNIVNDRVPKKKGDVEDLNNKIIMDYKFYTFLLDKNNNIIDIINHNEKDYTDSIRTKAIDIISNSNSKIRINNLYFSNISYNFKYGNYLVIADTSDLKERLLSSLSISIIMLILFEILVYFFSKRITKWITNPIEDMFNKQKDFIADASHELKTPLSVIIASTDCIKINKNNEKWINNIKSESERMNNLITKLLDLSKSENIKNNQVYMVNNLSKIVEKRVLVFESLAYENKVKIESNIDENIMFKCSKSDIDELVGIIIDNAIRHSFSNSKVIVNLYKEKNNIIIDVTNSGKEIKKDECDKIFERFYRSDKSRNRNSNRYGLGLAIAKNIVSNHDGEIKVVSKDNKTTFKIIFKNKH